MRTCRALLLLLTTVPPIASATCPSTRYDLYGVTTTSSETSGSASAWNPYYPYDGDGTVSWNAAAGTLSVSDCSAGHHGWAGGQIWMTDDFEILGSPTGVPVRITAALDVSGSSFYDFSYGTTSSGALSDATGRSVSGQNGADGLTIRLQLPLDMVTGVPQQLTYMAYGSASGFCTRTGARLLFPDLPPGMSIVSCRGFQTGAVTATRSTSWGRLKQIYR